MSLTTACPMMVPTKVGPPPISPSSARKPHAGSILPAGQRSDDPEAFGGVVQPEPDDQQQRQADLAAGGGLPDGQTFGEVVQADSDRDHQCQAAGGVHRSLGAVVVSSAAAAAPGPNLAAGVRVRRLAIHRS